MAPVAGLYKNVLINISTGSVFFWGLKNARFPPMIKGGPGPPEWMQLCNSGVVSFKKRCILATILPYFRPATFWPEGIQSVFNLVCFIATGMNRVPYRPKTDPQSAAVPFKDLARGGLEPVKERLGLRCAPLADIRATCICSDNCETFND